MCVLLELSGRRKHTTESNGAQVKERGSQCDLGQFDQMFVIAAIINTVVTKKKVTP